MKDQISIRLSTQEINLVLEALGNLPFIQVYGLISQIQSQAAEALQRDQTAADAPQSGAA